MKNGLLPVMRKVEIFKYERHKTHPSQLIPVPTGEIGIFHQFGVDYEEFESGPGNFTTAIVEMPDGTVKNIPVSLIKFTDNKSLNSTCGTIGQKQAADVIQT